MDSVADTRRRKRTYKNSVSTLDKHTFELLQLHKQGLSYPQIIEHLKLKISVSALSRWYKKHG